MALELPYYKLYIVCRGLPSMMSHPRTEEEKIGLRYLGPVAVR